MRARFINEKFKEDTDPIKDMGIGMDHYIYGIEKTADGSFNFKRNSEKLANLIKKCNPGISKNEIDRFWAFEMDEIYDEIEFLYFEDNNLKAIDSLIERGVEDHSRGWLGMHSDNAMRRGMR